MYKTIDMPTRNEKLLDNAAFEALFKGYFTPLCAWCQYKFDFELDTAKEAVHSGFIKLWENRHSITPDLSVKAYLYKVVTNICLDMLRHEQVKQKHVRIVMQDASAITFDEGYGHPDMKQLAADIDRAVSELPDQMRRIFELSRYEGLKYAEISQTLNISIKTVETQMSRALVKLRQKLSVYLTTICVAILFSL